MLVVGVIVAFVGKVLLLIIGLTAKNSNIRRDIILNYMLGLLNRYRGEEEVRCRHYFCIIGKNVRDSIVLPRLLSITLRSIRVFLSRKRSTPLHDPNKLTVA